MRVIAGEAKGRRLRVPAGASVRPTGARMRTSAFDILAHRDAIRDARVLDLYAGAGGLGIEALSRGARSLVAVERDPTTARMLQENLRVCGLDDRASVIVGAVEKVLPTLGGGNRVFDLVLLDPPYAAGLLPEALGALDALQLCAAGAWVVAEHPATLHLEAVGCLRPSLERRQGDAAVTVFRRSTDEVPSDALH